MHPHRSMAIFILNKTSRLEPKSQKRVESAYINISCSKLREKASRQIYVNGTDSPLTSSCHKVIIIATF
jgi:hypothetical protein